MIWDLMNFALLGFMLGLVALFMGAKERLEQPLQVVIALISSVIGALLGGMASWYFWPALDGQFHFTRFMASILGGALALGLSSVIMQRLERDK